MASPQSPDGRRNEEGTFKFGDLVWARVGSHYWPGHIFHPSLASESARDRQIPGDGRLLVSFFGDDSYGWYRPNQLLPFDRYFQRMSRQATRDPDLLEKTAREALDEVWRWAALGLTCRGLTEECRGCAGEIAEKDVGGFFDVRVMDDEWSKIYSRDQIEEARRSFPLEKALGLIRRSAARPTAVKSDTEYLHLVQMVGTAMAYRRRCFAAANERYVEEFRELTGNPNVTVKSLIEHEFGKNLRKDSAAEGKRKSLVTQRDKTPSEKVHEKRAASVPKKPRLEPGSSSKAKQPILKLQGRITSSSDQTKNIGEIGQNHSESTSKEPVLKKKMKKMRSLSSLYASETTAVGVFDHNATTVSNAFISSHRKRYEESPSYEPDKETAVSATNLSESSPENNDPDMVSDRKRASSDHLDENAAAEKVKRVEDSAVYELDKRQSSQNEPAGKGLMAPIALYLSKPSRGNGHNSSENVASAKVNARKKYMNLATERRTADVNAKGIKKRSVHNEKPLVILKKGEQKKEMAADGNTAGRTERSTTEPQSPTYLILEFPEGSKLPSCAELNATVGRYGSLYPEQTRIRWGSHSCSVLFKSRSGAEAADMGVKTRNLFQFKVIKSSVVDPVPAAKKGGGSESLPLKSCLKKRPIDDQLQSNTNRTVEAAPSTAGSFNSQVQEDDRAEKFKLKMLDLLLRCNAIVNTLKATPGYRPYQPL